MLAKLRETLTSRKLWATVAAAIPLVLDHNWTALAALVAVYVGAQGAVDVAHKLSQRPAPESVA